MTPPPKISATIQARMGSSRFPGKVLAPILGKPMLELQLERIRQSRLIDEIIVATSTKAQDDGIERLARKAGALCHRGSEGDVLGRVIGAFKQYRVELNVEFMGDSPLPDAALVDAFLGYFLKHAASCDYLTNRLKTTYPPGAEITIYPASLLIRSEAEAVKPEHREHVGLHIYTTPGYRVCNLEAPPGLRAPDLYLLVDEPEDLEVIRAIYERFYPGNPGFTLAQVIAFLQEHPELAQRNQGIERRWRIYRQDPEVVR